MHVTWQPALSLRHTAAMHVSAMRGIVDGAIEALKQPFYSHFLGTMNAIWLEMNRTPSSGVLCFLIMVCTRDKLAGSGICGAARKLRCSAIAKYGKSMRQPLDKNRKITPREKKGQTRILSKEGNASLRKQNGKVGIKSQGHGRFLSAALSLLLVQASLQGLMMMQK